MLENWIGNLIQRQFEGRAGRIEIKSLTKQRSEAYYDLELKTKITHELMSILPDGL